MGHRQVRVLPGVSPPTHDAGGQEPGRTGRRAAEVKVLYLHKLQATKQARSERNRQQSTEYRTPCACRTRSSNTNTTPTTHMNVTHVSPTQSSRATTRARSPVAVSALFASVRGPRRPNMVELLQVGVTAVRRKYMYIVFAVRSADLSIQTMGIGYGFTRHARP